MKRTAEITAEEDDENMNFSINQNYPNPFNPSTIINYSLSKRTYVNLRVYDILGNVVSTLVSLYKEKG